MPRYPDIFVPLVGQDGDAFFILGRVADALRNGDVPSATIDTFYEEATSGDYNHLLVTVMEWVSTG